MISVSTIKKNNGVDKDYFASTMENIIRLVIKNASCSSADNKVVIKGY